MSRTRRFVSGVGFGYVNHFLVTLVGLWLTPFLLGRLGTERLGLWLLVAQLLSYLLLLDLGVIALLPREVAYAWGMRAADGRAPDVPPVIARAMRLLTWQLPVIAIAALVLWILLPAQWSPLRGPLALALAVFVITYPLRLVNAVLEGVQEQTFLGRTFLVGWALGTLATVSFVLAGFGLWAVVLGWAVNQVALGALWAHRLFAYYRALLPSTLPKETGEALHHLRRGLWVSLSQVATVLVYGSDLLIIGKVLGAAAVVPYAMTAKLVSVLQHQPHVLMHMALPGIAELRARADREGVLRVVMGLMLGMLLISGGIAAVIMLVNRAFVAWWVGPSLYGGDLMTILLLLVMLLRHWGLVMAHANFALGDERWNGIVGITEGIVTAAASLALVHFYGPLGALFGALIGVLLVRLPAHAVELARRMETSVPAVLGTVTPWAWRAGIALVVAAVGAHLLPVEAPERGRDPRVLLVLALASSVIGLTYAALMYGLVRRSVLAPYVARLRAAAQRGWTRLRAREAHG